MACISVPGLDLEVRVAEVEFGQILTRRAVLASLVGLVWMNHCPLEEYLVSQLHSNQMGKANQRE